MLRLFLQKFIRLGDLALIMPDGGRHRFGDGTGRLVIARITSRRAAAHIALHADLALGEAYTDGTLVLERGSIWDLLEICGRNIEAAPPWNGFVQNSLAAPMRRFRQINARRAAQRNVAHHYDLSEAFYRGFLDADMQYSCAYFRDPHASLEEAQQAKLAHVAAKLALRPGDRVLDIGCGWGGLALHLARRFDVRVHGISLSAQQLDVCRMRAAAADLGDRVTFEMTDYRDAAGRYDRIVSVGMFEHVGTPNYAAYFEAIERLLAPDGVALVHAIGRAHGPSYTSAWVRKYIFPGGYAPALSQVVPHVERAGLWLTDLEVLRLHYAETLRHWRRRFLASRGAPGDEDEARFTRLWEFYLAVSEMSFRNGGFMVFQVQLAKRVDALPVTRSYMDEAAETTMHEAAE